jgi:DinB family protein
MDSRALLRDQLAVTYQILVRSLADISDDESCRTPIEALSPVIWHLGHLVVTDASIARKAGGVAAAAPADYAPLFKTGTGGKADYPPLGEIASAFDDTHAALGRAVAEAKLDAPDEGPGGLWKDVTGMIMFANNHRWYHIGKITSLGSLLSRPRLFG